MANPEIGQPFGKVQEGARVQGQSAVREPINFPDGRTEVETTLRNGKHFQPLNGVQHEIFTAIPTRRESINPVLDAKRLLTRHVETPVREALGTVIARKDIESSIGQFSTLPEYKTRYPEVVTSAIGDLYQEYNRAFDPLVRANTEWKTDYQYTRSGPNGSPVNRWVQIDMVGLPQEFLDRAEGMDPDAVRGVMRGSIFEIENSLAMYQLLERTHSHNGESTRFDRQFRGSLQGLRQAYGKPVALLAVTDQKYHAMKEAEFGKTAGDPLPDDEVRRLTGFDRFFGPDDYLDHLRETRGNSEYLLYVRSSDPLAKLKKPDTVVVNPLLEDDEIRRIIKANAITLNVDNPRSPLGSIEKINDTKAYMPMMGMAYRVDDSDDAWTVENGNEQSKVTLNDRLKEYLLSQGIDPAAVNSGVVNLRAKPMQAAYGGYGHIALRTINRNDRKDLKRGLRERGPYIIQPEMATPVITNVTDGQRYTYIDRNFFSTDGKNYQFMGGFRALMPIESEEAQQKRVHGNHSTVWAEIS